MNEQKAPAGIEWCRVYGRRGYTWNPVTGCQHACQWQMPDGNIAQCYAKSVAEGVALKSYPHGFEEHTFHADRLSEPVKLKEPAGIFLDSMSDLMGYWVTEREIQQVLNVCRSTPQHIYFLLTKNAPRLIQFEFPSNVWVGASSPPDFMFGKPLDREQQARMLHRTLKVLSRVNVPVRWISFEPLSWDVAPIVEQYPGALQWAVVGAASNGRQEYPPLTSDLRGILDVLDKQEVNVFFKGNMRSLPWARDNWREQFPGEVVVPKPEVLPVAELMQLQMF